MNIQIYGKKKCFDTKKAERYFKERRVKYQFIDLDRFGLGRRELDTVRAAVGVEALIDEKDPDAALLHYLASDAARLDKLFEEPWRIKTPIVRNGKQATVGYQPDVWTGWE